jgi:hypothetical protein
MNYRLFTSWWVDPKYSWLLFTVTFAILWLIGITAAKYLGKKSLVYFIGGDDDRLSLAKFQVFIWTFVIMSSYVAAMFIYIPQPDPEDLTKILQWVTIPAQILMLMGISISGTVLSSVISAVKDEARTAFVREIKYDEANSEIKITGGNFGSVKGAVRIHLKNEESDKKWELSIKEDGWKDDEIVVLAEKRVSKILENVKFKAKNKEAGIEAAVLGKAMTDSAKDEIKAKILAGNYAGEKTSEQLSEIKNQTDKLFEKAIERDVLIVDTKNGKAAYYLIVEPEIRLGRPTIYYEFVDFFRDDLNPSVLSILKYQLFGWTLVAVVLYIYKFLQLDHASTSLPEISPTVVILTGVSTAGYLAGKSKPSGS